MMHFIQVDLRKHLCVVTAVAVALSLGFGGVASAVNPLPFGIDMLETTAVTQFNIPGLGYTAFVGNPSALTEDCGAANTYDTDTIVERLQDAFAPVDTIPVEIVALELVSAAQHDLGNGAEWLYVSLNTDTGGSTMTIYNPVPANFGTMDSHLEFFFDLYGSVSGYITTDSVVLESSAQNWRWGAGNCQNGVAAGCSTPSYMCPWVGWTEEHIADDEEKHSVKDSKTQDIPTLSDGGLAAFGLLLFSFMARAVYRRG
jgi:hypothetical protein